MLFNGLALMYIYIDVLKNQTSMVVEEIIKLFCVEARRVKFLFNA